MKTILTMVLSFHFGTCTVNGLIKLESEVLEMIGTLILFGDEYEVEQ